MGLLERQQYVSPQRGFPVDDKGNSSTIVSVTGETVQMYYSNAGVMTADAGQAAGTAVVAQLAYDNVKNALGSIEGSKLDTSLSFTSTALTSEIEVNFQKINDQDYASFATRLAAITDGMTNGQYCVDYTNGTIYGKKASVQSTLTSTVYKIQAGVAGGNVLQNTNANTPSIASAATALAANARRTYFMISNLGTNPLFVRFGDSASTTVFHVVLAAGNANDDGLGASYESGVVCYTGIVTIAGTSPRYTVYEATS